MDRVAASNANDRAFLFRRTETAMARGCHATIVEKDFWVCWTLHRIFEVLRFRPSLIFGEAPTWDEIVEGLRALVVRINGLRKSESGTPEPAG